MFKKYPYEQGMRDLWEEVVSLAIKDFQHAVAFRELMALREKIGYFNALPPLSPYYEKSEKIRLDKQNYEYNYTFSFIKSSYFAQLTWGEVNPNWLIENLHTWEKDFVANYPTEYRKRVEIGKRLKEVKPDLPNADIIGAILFSSNEITERIKHTSTKEEWKELQKILRKEKLYGCKNIEE